jgi:nitrite reductase/ring-hydroxylating ferredoxin subunit
MNYFIKVFAISLIILCVGCTKSSNNGIPYAQVNIQLYTTDPAFFNLGVVGGWEYINGGSKGILVYRSGIDNFKAYDRHCPYQPSDACSKIFVDSSDIIAVDSCCGSEFVITSGDVSKDPAVESLKEYQTSYDGTVLTITN